MTVVSPVTLVIGVGVSTTVGVVAELVVVLVDKGVGVSSKVVKFRFFLHNSADLHNTYNNML